MIHVDSGGSKDVSKWFFDNCRKRGVQFDVIGLSYYPFWQGFLTGLRENLAFLSHTYSKDIMVAETGYNAAGNSQGTLPFPLTPSGQKAFLDELMRTVAAAPDGRGKGVFYWAPEWIMGEKWNASKWSGQWEDRALFDRAGNMRPAMDAYEFEPAEAK